MGTGEPAEGAGIEGGGRSRQTVRVRGRGEKKRRVGREDQGSGEEGTRTKPKRSDGGRHGRKESRTEGGSLSFLATDGRGYTDSIVRVRRSADNGVVTGIASTAGNLLSREGSQIGRVVREVGGTLRATHIDGDRIRAYSDGVGRSRVPRRWRRSLGQGYQLK